ncbi:MAG: PAS domain-containing protein, partial [Candidatus Thermoplasmatota archaeon]|nr:PAS domain-containing protein [Candidatus Thermoplasmatota archaeon]
MAEDGRSREQLLAEIKVLKDRIAGSEESEEEPRQAEEAMQETGKRSSPTQLATDVTITMAATDALKESEERYRRLADSTFEGLVLHDNGTIVDANKRIEEIAGYSREELIGTNMFGLLEPGSHDLVRRKIQEDDESPYEVEA